MFKAVELTNFRQHQSLTVNFENGVVALRGANEAGKSTLLEAMAYAMFGAVAIRKGDTLDDVVTWGQKVSSLKVLLHFTLNGVDYMVKRSKSGAEIKCGVQIMATGQTEVRRYVESLLGASAETCSNLMLADQQALRGALTKGPGAAIELIEELANFKLIDTIIGLVQTKLPNGATTAVEARVGTLDAQLAIPVVDETGPLKQAVSDAELELASATDTQDAASASYRAVQSAALGAATMVDTHQRATAAAMTAAHLLESAKATLEGIKPVPGPTEAEVAALHAAAADVGRLDRAKVAKRALDALPEPENEWEGGSDSLMTERGTTANTINNLTKDIEDHKRNHAVARASIITQTACGLCGKDLSKVPEVTQKNFDLNEQMRAIEETVGMLEKERAEAQETLTALDGILAADRARQRPYTQYTEFIALDHGYVPARWTWTGPDVNAAVPGNPAQALREAEAKVQAYQRDQGRLDQAQHALEQADNAHEAAMHAVAVAEKPLEAAQATLLDAAAKTQALNAADETLRNAQQAHQTALQALNGAKAVLAERQRARDLLETQAKQARADLDSMRFNNDLIKALRDARPDIADELWGIMSASVSKYFSDIRGTPSVFTREDGGFEVDGHSINSLSGSALDALGLAIRIGLVRTFLPNTRFLNLDEPAAACDEGRETNMLGVIATSEFDQVILVTHSDLSDSFASQVIRL